MLIDDDLAQTIKKNGLSSTLMVNGQSSDQDEFLERLLVTDQTSYDFNQFKKGISYRLNDRLGATKTGLQKSIVSSWTEHKEVTSAGAYTLSGDLYNSHGKFYLITAEVPRIEVTTMTGLYQHLAAVGTALVDRKVRLLQP